MTRTTRRCQQAAAEFTGSSISLTHIPTRTTGSEADMERVWEGGGGGGRGVKRDEECVRVSESSRSLTKQEAIHSSVTQFGQQVSVCVWVCGVCMGVWCVCGCVFGGVCGRRRREGRGRKRRRRGRMNGDNIDLKKQETNMDLKQDIDKIFTFN